MVDLEKLTEPFPLSAHKHRQLQGKSLTYVEGHTVIHRLNAATGNTWSLEVKRIDTVQLNEDWRQVTAHVALTIPGLGTREHIGIQDVHVKGADLVKGAVTDALKKAATLFGVGLELYGPDYEAGDVAPVSQPSRAQPRDSAPPPERAPVTQPRGQSPAGLDEAASQRQFRYLQAVARERGLDPEALDARSEREFGVVAQALTRRDASTLIDLLQGGVQEPAQTGRIAAGQQQAIIRMCDELGYTTEDRIAADFNKGSLSMLTQEEAGDLITALDKELRAHRAQLRMMADSPTGSSHFATA
jgi:hypothetical protein